MAIVLEFDYKSYTCKSFIKLTPGFHLRSNMFFIQGKVHLIWQGGGGDEDIGGGLRKFLDTRRGRSEKIVVLGGGAPKIFILQNQHMTSSYRSDDFQLNNLMTCATQLNHVVYRYNKM